MSPQDLAALLEARHADPFGVLGPHPDGAGSWSLRVFLPGAQAVHAVGPQGEPELAALRRVHPEGVFEGRLAALPPAGYRLRVSWPGAPVALIDDPYRFGPVLGELDAWLLAEGTHLRPAEALGAAPCEHGGRPGTRFAVWAPSAASNSMPRVSVSGGKPS